MAHLMYDERLDNQSLPDVLRKAEHNLTIETRFGDVLSFSVENKAKEIILTKVKLVRGFALAIYYHKESDQSSVHVRVDGKTTIILPCFDTDFTIDSFVHVLRFIETPGKAPTPQMFMRAFFQPSIIYRLEK